MMQELEEVNAKKCPFCGEFPYLQPVRGATKIETHFFHPGVVTDKGCILSGKGFDISQLDKWNERTPE